MPISNEIKILDRKILWIARTIADCYDRRYRFYTLTMANYQVTIRGTQRAETTKDLTRNALKKQQVIAKIMEIMLRELDFRWNHWESAVPVRKRTVKSAESRQVICHGEISLRVFNSPVGNCPFSGFFTSLPRNSSRRMESGVTCTQRFRNTTTTEAAINWNTLIDSEWSPSSLPPPNFLSSFVTNLYI